MIGVILISVGIIAAVLYFFMTAAHPVTSWLKEYNYAHRGLHNEKFPENSVPAFENALQQGYAIELDVHLSKDGTLMVFHDDELLRMTGMPGKVEDYTADELREMKLGDSIYCMPTLDEVLVKVAGKTPLLIELKNIGRAGDLEIELCKKMMDYKGRFAVQSFSPFSMRWFYKNAPEILRGQLSATFYSGADIIPRWQRWTLRHLMTNVICRPNFINYEQSGIARNIIKRLRKRGLPILAWTVRTDKEEREVSPFADALVFEGIRPKGEPADA